MSAEPVCTVDYIDHVGIAVRDIDAALKLYHDIFGAPLAEAQAAGTIKESAGRWFKWVRPAWS